MTQSPQESPRQCPNCSTPWVGAFCHQCGQKDTDLRRGLFTLVSEGLSEVFELDGKIPRSLIALLVKPGELTRRWLDGERARFSSPIRMYLFAVVLSLFAVNCTADRAIGEMAAEGWIRIQVDEERDLPAFAIGDPATPNTFIFHAVIDEVDASTFDLAILDMTRDRPGEIATKELLSTVMEQVPIALVVLMVLTGLFLQLAWWKRFVAEHALFSLNLHTIGLYAVVVTLWVPWIGGWIGRIALLVHLVWGLKRVYGAGWPRTLATSIALIAGWLFAFGVVLLGLFLLALHQRGSGVEQAQQRLDAIDAIEAPASE